MSSTDDKALKFLAGIPVRYQDICLVKSPFLKDIAAEGVTKFYQYISFLTISKPKVDNTEVSKLLSPLSDFDYLLLLAQMEPENYNLIKSAFRFFTGETPILVPTNHQIVIGPPDEKRILTNENFLGFSELIKCSCAMLDMKKDTIQFLETDSPKVRELKEKMLKGRRDLEKIKRNQAQKDGKKELELSDLIGSLAIGSNSYNMLNIWDLTYYAFQDQLKRMSWREEFDINTRAALAGAKLDKDKLSHWIKSMTF